MDGSSVYDDNGYATVPPKWHADHQFDGEEILRELRAFGPTRTLATFWPS
jgi:hypothetical protein